MATAVATLVGQPWFNSVDEIFAGYGISPAVWGTEAEAESSGGQNMSGGGLFGLQSFGVGSGYTQAQLNAMTPEQQAVIAAPVMAKEINAKGDASASPQQQVTDLAYGAWPSDNPNAPSSSYYGGSFAADLSNRIAILGGLIQGGLSTTPTDTSGMQGTGVVSIPSGAPAAAGNATQATGNAVQNAVQNAVTSPITTAVSTLQTSWSTFWTAHPAWLILAGLVLLIMAWSLIGAPNPMPSANVKVNP